MMLSHLFLLFSFEPILSVTIFSKPTKLRYSHTSVPTAVTIYWSPPENIDGKITSYHVLYTDDQNLNDRKWTKHKVVGHYKTLQSLIGNTKYFVKIKAIINGNELSQSSEVLEFLTKPVLVNTKEHTQSHCEPSDTKPKIMDISNQGSYSVIITWQAPKCYNGKIKEYQIYYKTNYKTKSVVVNTLRNGLDINVKQLHIINDLDMDKNYEFTIRVKTSDDKIDAYSPSYQFISKRQNKRSASVTNKQDQNGIFAYIFVILIIIFSMYSRLIIYYSYGYLDRKWTREAFAKLESKITSGYDEIDKAEIQLLDRIGNGNFSQVHRGKFLHRAEVVIKILNEDQMSREAFKEEAAMMRRCRHKQLIKMYAVSFLNGDLWIISEFLSNGSLYSYLRKKDLRVLKYKDLLNICSKVAEGMMYLESINVVHRDLAARNILVEDNNLVKIADLGLARVTNFGKFYIPTITEKIPTKWTAPEAALKRIFSSKSDIWSYGVLLYEVVTFGEEPYKGMDNNEALDKICEEKFRLAKPKNGCPNEYYNIMLECWNEDLEKRPSFEELFKFFKFNQRMN